MKKFKTVITIFLLLSFIPATFVGGKLSDFKDDLRKADDTSNITSNDKDRKNKNRDKPMNFGELLSTVLDKTNRNKSKPKKVRKSWLMNLKKVDGYSNKNVENTNYNSKIKPPAKIMFLGYNRFQTFPRYPYQYEDTPFNLHFDLYQKQPAHRKKWSLATTIEYQRFDDQLNALVLDLDLTFAGFLKLKVSSNSLQEKMFNYKDSLTLFNFMFGLDLITANNFIFGSRLGFQKVTDLDLNMIAYDLYIRFFPKRPLVVDLLWTKAIYNDVTTQELKVRLGFLVGMNDFGIGYSWLKLDTKHAINAVNFSVRFWM